MKIFLSWSGKKSHNVALAFRDWLPSVIQSVVPYVSSEDIDKGARWSTDIAKELEDSAFGIICVTKQNLKAPWLTFEAGALSKKLEKSFVSPFLFNMKRAEIDGPILQFQSTINEKEDIKKLLKTINKACLKDKLTDERLEIAFDVWYPKLEEKLTKIETDFPDEAVDIKEAEAQGQEMLEEILELTRINQKILRSPESLLPAKYVDHVLRRDSGFNKEFEEENDMIFHEIRHLVLNLRHLVEFESKSKKSKDNDEIYYTVKKLNDLIEHFEFQRRRRKEKYS